MFQVIRIEFFAGIPAAEPKQRCVRKFTKQYAAKEYAASLNRGQDLVGVDSIVSFYVKEVCETFATT